MMVNKFGGIELDKDEESFLSLGPDFSLYEELSQKRIEKDFLIAAMKIRWARMGKPPEEIKYERKIEE